MNDFLDQVILDNSIRDYLIVIGIILFFFLFKRYLSKYFAGLLFRIVRLVLRDVQKPPFVNLVLQPLQILLVVVVTMIAFEQLTFPTALKFSIYKTSFHAIVESCSKIILLVVFTWFLLRVIDFTAIVLEQKANLTAELTDNQLVSFFKDFLKVIVGIIGFVLVLKFAFNFQVSSLLTGLSIATAAIALATRESLENLIASFIIFFDKPFSAGDFVKVQQVTGTVERIGLRSTRIRTTEKSYVTVPNKQMVDSILDNLSLRTHRRTLINLELHPLTAVEKVNALLAAITALLKNNKLVDTNTVLFADITRDSFIVQVEYFVLSGTQEAFNAIKQDVNLQILRLLDQTGIKLATKETEIIITESK